MFLAAVCLYNRKQLGQAYTYRSIHDMSTVINKFIQIGLWYISMHDSISEIFSLLLMASFSELEWVQWCYLVHVGLMYLTLWISTGTHAAAHLQIIRFLLVSAYLHTRYNLSMPNPHEKPDCVLSTPSLLCTDETLWLTNYPKGYQCWY